MKEENSNESIHLALGFFDGIHLGHRAVIESAYRAAQKNGGRAQVMSFSNHPLSLIAPERAPVLITPDCEEKALIIKELGVHDCVFPHFDERMASQSPENFIKGLRQIWNLKSISVGEDWRFGKGKQGNAELLKRLGDEWGFDVYIIPDYCDAEGIRISSTRVRQGLACGDVESVALWLGRYYALRGEVVYGRQLARQWGFPTANVVVSEKALLPCFGVYIVHVYLDDESGFFHGIANLGKRPSVEQGLDAAVFLEVHILDFHRDIYGKQLKVEFHHFLRPEKKFDSLDDLKNQIESDYQKMLSFVKK